MMGVVSHRRTDRDSTGHAASGAAVVARLSLLPQTIAATGAEALTVHLHARVAGCNGAVHAAGAAAIALFGAGLVVTRFGA